MEHYKEKREIIGIRNFTEFLFIILFLILSISIFGNSSLVDNSGDEPMVTLKVDVDHEFVGGYTWPLGAEVTLTIDDPTTLESPDYSDTGTVVKQEWYPGETKVHFQLGGLFEVQPGHIVTLTDGMRTKEHIVTNLSITSVDLNSDTVSGTADPYDEIEVWTNDPRCNVFVTADGNGNWIADFGNYDVDIELGTDGSAIESDGDRDQTWRYWEMRFNEPPVAICMDIAISADENCEACIVPEDIDSGSYDPDDNPITLSVDNLGPFSIGEHYVNLTVTDENGASNTCQAKVTVVDTTPPAIESIAASPNVLWPPNHKMVEVTLNVSAIDNCDVAPFCEVISVSSNEPENGLGDDDTAPDWKITGPFTVNLRAERSGTGSGRIYTITVQCTDESGNSSTAQIAVTVPKSKGEKK